jgi:hypothetical protein
VQHGLGYLDHITHYYRIISSEKTASTFSRPPITLGFLSSWTCLAAGTSQNCAVPVGTLIIEVTYPLPRHRNERR